MEEQKEVLYDIDSFDVVTSAILDLINQFPGLADGDDITFAVLGEDGGKAMFPVSGAVIETEKKSVTGQITQVCLYPFYVVYRAKALSEGRKAGVKEWLDNLGKWLEKQEIIINDTEYRIMDYPALTGRRKFLSIARQTSGYLDSVNDNKSENWAIYISARYENKFHK